MCQFRLKHASLGYVVYSILLVACTPYGAVLAGFNVGICSRYVIVVSRLVYIAVGLISLVACTPIVLVGCTYLYKKVRCLGYNLVLYWAII